MFHKFSTEQIDSYNVNPKVLNPKLLEFSYGNVETFRAFDKEVWKPIDGIREYGNQVDFVEPYSMEI